MGPAQIAACLRRIASRIDSSKRPDARFVAQDIRRVIAFMKTAEGENPDEPQPAGDLKIKDLLTILKGADPEGMVWADVYPVEKASMQGSDLHLTSGELEALGRLG